MNTKKLLSMLLSAAVTLSFAGFSQRLALPTVQAADNTEYPIVTRTERFADINTLPDKRIYNKDTYLDDFDISGLSIIVNEDIHTRMDYFSGFSQIVRHEYKIGKIYDNEVNFNDVCTDLVHIIDPETGETVSKWGESKSNKVDVHIYSPKGILRFSEPDNPDVIHEAEDCYVIDFPIYIEDNDSSNKIVLIDEKEITDYSFGNNISIKDIGDFNLDMDTYNYKNYYIDSNIQKGDIVSGAFYIDTDRNYIIGADLKIVRPAVGNGDANCDGKVDMSDVVFIMQYLANPNKYGLDGTEKIKMTIDGLFNGDVNGGGITVQDAEVLQKKLLGIE